MYGYMAGRSHGYLAVKLYGPCGCKAVWLYGNKAIRPKAVRPQAISLYIAML